MLALQGQVIGSLERTRGAEEDRRRMFFAISAVYPDAVVTVGS